MPQVMEASAYQLCSPSNLGKVMGESAWVHRGAVCVAEYKVVLTQQFPFQLCIAGGIGLKKVANLAAAGCAHF